MDEQKPINTFSTLHLNRREHEVLKKFIIVELGRLVGDIQYDLKAKKLVYGSAERLTEYGNLTEILQRMKEYERETGNNVTSNSPIDTG